MSWWRTVAACVSLLSAAACTTVSNPLSCADGFCDDPAFPFCDVDGTIGGGGRLTCIAVACTPLAFEACRGDEAIICNATGDGYDITRCQSGCDAERAGCAATHIVPKYLPNVCDSLATEPALSISESITLDTSDDASCNGGVVAQVNGPEICVLRYGSITVERNKTFRVKGARALAMVADGSLVIDGTLDVSANSVEHGPGGGFVELPFIPPPGQTAGFGGVGFRTAGGSGGTSTADGGAANGSAALMDPALLVELVSSPRGYFAGGYGGGGTGGAGGAVTLISCRGTLSVPGLIDAGGGGGSGGWAILESTISAMGGGAGGNVVLQGMMVEVTGQVFANGGSGGAGCRTHSGNAETSQMGADGSRSTTAGAPGGSAQNLGGGDGGAGGFGDTPPAPGRRSLSGSAGGGGGGGSAGFLQTYTPPDVSPRLEAATASPSFQPNRGLEAR